MAEHPCPRCGSEEWEYIDYGGCSECRPYEEREHEDDGEAEIVVNGEIVGYGLQGMLNALRKMLRQHD
jgi:hypothetical protein